MRLGEGARKGAAEAEAIGQLGTGASAGGGAGEVAEGACEGAPDR